LADPDKAAIAGGRRLLVVAALGGALALFLAVGGLGLYRYLDGFWLYRGFPAPREPAFVHQTGQVNTIHVKSAAVGGSRPARARLPPAGLRLVVLVSRAEGGGLAPGERRGVAGSVLGLALLAVSLPGSAAHGGSASLGAVGVWVAVAVAAAELAAGPSAAS
jgi:hypothetical protein